MGDRFPVKHVTIIIEDDTFEYEMITPDIHHLLNWAEKFNISKRWIEVNRCNDTGAKSDSTN